MTTLSFIKRIILMLIVSSFISGCALSSRILNPFYTSPPPEATLGEKNDRALNEGGGKSENARAALENMSSYQRQHTPQPYNPVIQPAVVRLMWIPDHLNKNGDLVPAHYYYLRVLKDRWAVQDAFDLESQLNTNGSSGNASAIPFALADDAEQ